LETDCVYLRAYPAQPEYLPDEADRELDDARCDGRRGRTQAFKIQTRAMAGALKILQVKGCAICA
jgi:hypothetical protein